jgi:hypothetical protein
MTENESDKPVFLEAEIREWLLKYAWANDSEAEKIAEIECIMSQGDWKYIDAMTEKYAGMASGEEKNAYLEANEFALSSLYECHTEPHLETCPIFKGQK